MSKYSKSKSSKIPTLGCVARLADTSPATVTRVINNRHLVSRKTAERVDRAIHELGYKVSGINSGGRPLKSKNSGKLGLVLSGFRGASLYSFPVFPSVLHGLERECEAQGKSLFVGNISEDGVLPRFIHEEQVEGIMVMGRLTGSEPFCRILSRLPCVSILTQTYPLGDQVLPDNQMIGEIAADYLAVQGCEALSVFNPSPDHPAFKARVQAFELRSGWYGEGASVIVSGSENVDRETDLSVSSLEISLVKLVEIFLADRDLGKRQGIFIPSDFHMIWLYRAFKSLNVDIGSNFSFISSDNDSAYLSDLNPKPYRIDIRSEEIGRRAVQQLLARISGSCGENRQRILIRPRLLGPDKDEQSISNSEKTRITPLI
jgi:DNA-binding LacI/PurR family transcriptional regulator